MVHERKFTFHTITHSIKKSTKNYSVLFSFIMPSDVVSALSVEEQVIPWLFSEKF
jgi:hypothetical protein